MPKKCVLIAIASNEGAHITPFINHHLALGFVQIHIVVNNSQDQTEKIVQKISAVDPRVCWIDGDPLRANPERFQKRAYMQVMKSLAPGDGPEDIFIMFLDIDEYWVPLDGSTSMPHHLDALGSPDLLVSNWFIPNPDARVFGPQLDATMTGYTHRLVKSIWRRATEGIRPQIHVPKVGPSASLVAASNPRAVLEDGKFNTRTRHPMHPGSSMVLHQMRRSPVEYVALMKRGRPDISSVFKSNRKGYAFSHNHTTQIDIRIPEFVMKNQACIKDLIEQSGIAPEIEQSQIMLLERCLEGINVWNSASDAVRAEYARAFSGVDLVEVEQHARDLLKDMGA